MNLESISTAEKAPFWLLPVPTEAPGKIEGCEIVTGSSVSVVAPYREFEILKVVYQGGLNGHGSIIPLKVNSRTQASRL